MFPMAQVATNPTVRRTAGDFLALTKPTIMLLVLVTGFLTLFVIPGEMPSPGLVVTTVLGTAMASGSANALNMYFDRDIDQIMKRTRTRPIPAGKVTPNEALMFGIGLGVASVALLWTTTNALAAVIALSGILFYVCVYTLFLKRRTPPNIRVGGRHGHGGPARVAAVLGHFPLDAAPLLGAGAAGLGGLRARGRAHVAGGAGPRRNPQADFHLYRAAGAADPGLLPHRFRRRHFPGGRHGGDPRFSAEGVEAAEGQIPGVGARRVHLLHLLPGAVVRGFAYRPRLPVTQ